MGERTRIKFWEGKWLPTCTFMSLFPRLYSLSIQQNFTISDVGGWDGEAWAWNFQWRRTMLCLFRKILYYKRCYSA